MGKSDDWFDDFMAMKIMEKDRKDHSGSRGSGCLPGILAVLAVLFLIGSLK